LLIVFGYFAAGGNLAHRGENVPGEGEQMLRFHIITLQRGGDGGEGFRGSLDIASLFQPGVPGNTHIGQLGHFFPT